MSNQYLETDVMVIGGGAAGIAAAIAASRAGSTVVLIEKNSRFGGKATSAVVGTICGAHFRSKNSVSRYVTRGFAMEFCEALKKISGTEPVPHYQGDLHFLPYFPFPFALAADELISKEKNIRCFFHASLTDVHLNDNSINELIFLNHDQKITVKAQQIIDCSGESTVSQLAGIETLDQAVYQASAVVFSLENIKTADPIQLSLAMLRAIKKATSIGELAEDFAKTSIVPGSISASSLFLKIALPFKIEDTIHNKTQVEFMGRNAVKKVADQLIKGVSYFKNAHIGFTAPEVGTRTGKLSKGKYVLQKRDVLECRRFDDGVAKGAWPLEQWFPGENVKMEFFDHDNHYEIPMRSLISDEIKNLYFAGRIISASPEAIASARVIGTCLSTGFAAGIAAAMTSKGSSMEAALEIIKKEQVYR